MGERVDSRLVVDALKMAVSLRLPGECLVAVGHGITGRMNRRANCWDNGPMESFPRLDEVGVGAR